MKVSDLSLRILASLGLSILCSISTPAFADPVVVSYTGPAVAIPDNNSGGVNISIPVSGVGTITDLNFLFTTGGVCDFTVGNVNAAVSHTYIGDLTFKLTSPTGVSRTFMARRGGTRENICATQIDDEGGGAQLSTITSASGSFLSGNFVSESASPLSGFKGINADGQWTLNVSDNSQVDTGFIRRFSLQFEPVPCQEFICSANIIAGVDAGKCSFDLTYATFAAPDCGGMVCSIPSGASFPLGVSNVNCQSNIGNRSCNFTVEILDNEAPELSCPESVFIPTANTAGEIATFDVSASDNCPGAQLPQCTRKSGDIFQSGLSMVDCSVTDAAALGKSCSFPVTILGGVSVDNLAGDPPRCVGGPALRKSKLVIKNIGSRTEKQSISLTGRVKFKRAQYATVNGQANGAQFNLTDVGNASATLYELSDRSRMIPGGGVGSSSTCSPTDGWVKVNSYVNSSNKVETPTCFDGTANGLTKLSLSAPNRKTGFSVFRMSVESTLLSQSAVNGPFSVATVFGANDRGDLGQCFTGSFKAARCRRKGSTLTCVN